MPQNRTWRNGGRNISCSLRVHGLVIIQVYGVGSGRMESCVESVYVVQSSSRSTFRLGGSVFSRCGTLQEFAPYSVYTGQTPRVYSEQEIIQIALRLMYGWTCEVSRFDSNSNRTSRFEFDSKMTCRFENFESAAHAVCRHITNYAHSLFNKNINLCAVCSWVYIYNSTLRVAVLL